MEFPRPSRLKVKVTFKEKLTEKVFRIRFEANENLEFLPGQFANVFIDKFTNRSYSIYSNPGHTYFETLVDISPGGVGSKFFIDLKEGDEIDTMMPLGRFVYHPGAEEVIFVATGTGIVPLRPMIYQELNKVKKAGKVKLVWGVRDNEDMFLQEEFEGLSKKHENFELINCLSGKNTQNTESKDNKYFSGRVTDYLVQNQIQSDSQMYICGGQDMINDVEKLAIEKGINKDSIYYEQFY